MKLYHLMAAAALTLPISHAMAVWQPQQPQQRPANILRSPQAPRGNIYGVVNRFQGMETTDQAYAARIDLTTGVVTPLHYSTLFSPYTGEDYLLQTNTLRHGEIICPSVYIDDNYDVSWDFIDLESGRYLRTIEFGANMMANAYSMTYDPDHDLIYMICHDGSTDGQFSVADPSKDFEVRYVANLRDKAGFVAAVAYNMADGQLYAFNDNNNVYTLDPKDGTLVEAGYLELPSGDLLFQEGVSGQVVYSPADQMFICIYRDNELAASRVLYIHPETFEVFEGTVLTGTNIPYITSVFCTDDFALPEAPELPAPIDAIFKDASLTGEVTVSVPTVTYAGLPLGTTPVRMKLTVDGDAVLDKQMAPGSSETLTLTLTEGEHDLELTAWIGEAVSPTRSLTLYVGNDAPTAPTGISLEEDLLTWKPVGAVGDHGGFVDTAAVTYNVYLDGTLQNPTPLTQTSLRLSVPTDFDLRHIVVTATANGHTSPDGVLDALFGAPLPLPFTQAPTRDETRFYTIENTNRDERAWFFTDEAADLDAPADSAPHGWCFATGYFRQANDWLFFPPLEITDPSKLHTIEYTIQGIFTIPTSEAYEVWIGKVPKSGAMLADGTCILSDPHYMATTKPQRMKLNFGVESPGTYHIAFRALGSAETDSQGILISDYDIRETETSSAVPADPTNVRVEAAPLGRFALTLSAKMPTLDLSGKQLPASTPLTLTFAEGDASVIVEGLPGTAVTAEIPIADSGYHYPSVTPASANGDGYTRYYSLYAGLDRPLAPANMHLEPSADNISLHLTWDAPGTVGENGAYVDPDNLVYKIYARSDSNAAMMMGQTTEREITINPFSVPNPAQTAFSFGVAASNDGGESYGTIYAYEHLGTPYDLPILDEFTNLDYPPYTVETGGAYANSVFELVSSMNSMGIGNPAFRQGGLIAYTQQPVRTEARLRLPKATTAGIAKADFMLRYWDYPESPSNVIIYGRRFGAPDPVRLGEFSMEHPTGGKWVDAKITLPEEFSDSPWIEIHVATTLRGVSNEYLVIDSYQLFPDADRDLKVTALTAPDRSMIGETITCNATVANSGRTSLGGVLNIEITDADGKVYAKEQATIAPLESNRSFQLSAEFDIDGAFRGLENLQVVARVDCSDDNMGNNTRTLPLAISTGTLPVVNDLTANPTDGGVRLEWSVPPTEYGDFESFEEFEPFLATDSFGQWKNYDLDGLKPYPLVNATTNVELKWPGSDVPQGWTVVDMEELGYMQDERLAPHSGTKVLMARSGDYPDEENPLQSSKWLVSPRIQGGTALSFWMSTIASDIKEFVEVWYSSTDDTLDPENATSTRNGSFRRLRTFSKEGSDAWELISCTLPSDAKFFAIRYCSYDSAAVVIDDISLTPAEMLSRQISHYTLYRSETGNDFRLLADNLLTPGYTDTTYDHDGAVYYVTTSGMTETGTAEGPASNKVYVGNTGIGEYPSDRETSIFTLPGRIILEGFEGEPYTVVAIDGRTVATGTVSAPRMAIAVEPGVYALRAGNRSISLIVR